ncbi:MAG TPA: hypothetical protein VGO47_05530, partial [Chlamydiales bacterium]|nr:hypothetical protein [Chlamydiales bacterium]
NCEARHILNVLEVTTAESFLQTLAELRNELETKVLWQMEVQLVGVLNAKERTTFLDILDQVRYMLP